MRNLKNLLRSKKFLLLFCVCLCVYVIYYIFHPKSSKYDIDDNNVTGIIINMKIDGNKVSMMIAGDENIIVNYYMKEKDEIIVFNNYKLGDKIYVEGVFKKVLPNTNFYLFNYKNYLMSKGIYTTFSADRVILKSENKNILYEIKNHMINRINRYKSSNYIKAFILGDTDDIDDEVNKSYQYNGVSHLLAVSGSHFTLLSLILMFILDKGVKNKNICYIIIIVFLLFYSFLTSFTPSVLRALLMFIFLYLNKLFKGGIKTDYILIYIVGLLLLYRPYYIFSIGFQFSFIISYFLIRFSTIIDRYNNYFVKSFYTSLIAFIASIPVLIYNFFSVNFLAVVLNLIFVPLVSFVLFPLALLTFIFPFLDGMLYFFVYVFEGVSLLFSKINIFNLVFCHMNIFLLFIYYLLIYLVLYKKRYVGIFVVVLSAHYIFPYINQRAFITSIDVGQGDSTLIRLPYNKGNILIDTGGIPNYVSEEWMRRKEQSLVANTIIPYLKSEGISELDLLVLTHGDYDHMGEAINLINTFKVEKVIFNSGNDNELEKEVMELLSDKKIPYVRVSKEEISINKYKFYFLNDVNSSNENGDSLIIYTTIKNSSILLMGDAGISSEEKFLDAYNIKNVDILKIGHHGSKGSSGQSFLDRMSPGSVIISSGRNNKFGHPHRDVLERLDNIHSRYFVTSINGSTKFIIDKKLEVYTCL